MSARLAGRLILGLTFVTLNASARTPAQPGAADHAPLLFTEDFERGLDRWQLIGAGTARVVAAGNSHGSVLELVPNGDAAALVRGSERWPRARLEGEMRFLTNDESYLGFVYAHTFRGRRQDFGLIYVKGDDSYLQVNPHRDFNVSRLLYPELHVDLTGPSAVVVGEWQRFALEVDGPVAHLYVGNASVPQVTFADFEGNGGRLGLQPRSVGGAVWVDNLTVRPIDRLSYAGAPIPARTAPDGSMITRWQLAGPFDRTDDRLARDAASSPGAWRAFATDTRGAVVTGRAVDYHGPSAVAYFRTQVPRTTAARAELQLATIDDIAIWVNGVFQGFLPRQDAAWFDAGVNPAHPARRVPLSLRAGENDIVIRVRGGVYASGGFFARLVEDTRAGAADLHLRE
jgi:hypothetical protein